MLLVKTVIKESPIHGFGLFADEDIKKGTMIWKFSPKLDLEISPSDFEKLNKYEKDFILFYGFNSRKSQNYHLSFDNIRFMNHSSNGNIALDNTVNDIEYPLIAVRDIKRGEELIQNYFEFDDNHKL